jgi:hypothetical protein
VTAQIFTGGAWRTITSGKIYIGGAWRTITRGSVYKGGSWKDGPAFVPPLSATASPSDAFGSTTGHFGATVTSNNVTVMPVGGLGPFTYSWAVGSGITASNPTGATTSFSKYLTPFSETIASATCTVTDSLGSTATAEVSIDLVHEGL